MTLNELLQKTLGKGYYDKYTLLIQHYGKCDERYYPMEFYTETPIYDKYGLSPTENQLSNYIVLIPFYSPIDIGRNWKHWNGLQTIVVTTREELLKHYSDKQLVSWLEWLDVEVRKEVYSKLYD